MVSLTLDPSLVLLPACGCEAIQGKRQYMEDRHVIFDNMKADIPSGSYKDDMTYSYWAVYDGHAGYKAAEICMNLLHEEIAQNEHFIKGDILSAIQVCEM